MKYTHCIWDFNGTLLDDMSAGIRAVNDLLRQRELSCIEDINAYRRVFGFPVKEYYERLGFDFSIEPYDVIAHEWVELYLRYVKDCGLSNGAQETIKGFADNGLTQILLSATEKDMLDSQLGFLGLENAFSEVLGLDNIFAASKVDIALKWRKNNVCANAFVIGDTEHDLLVAKAIGADCYLLSCGHQSRERLEKLGAPVFEELFELTEYLNNNGLIQQT